MKKSKPAKPTKPTTVSSDKLSTVIGGAGTSSTGGVHPNPPVGPGG